MAITLQYPPKFTPIGIFSQKTNHLATLLEINEASLLESSVLPFLAIHDNI
jgi:hypothetical protein